jgi:hypothetical protein
MSSEKYVASWLDTFGMKKGALGFDTEIWHTILLYRPQARTGLYLRTVEGKRVTFATGGRAPIFSQIEVERDSFGNAASFCARSNSPLIGEVTVFSPFDETIAKICLENAPFLSIKEELDDIALALINMDWVKEIGKYNEMQHLRQKDLAAKKAVEERKKKREIRQKEIEKMAGTMERHVKRVCRYNAMKTFYSN